MKPIQLLARQVPRNTLLTAALVLFWLAATAWARPLMLPDEGRYVGVALEMLRSGDWLTPTLNGLPYFHKPPLFYWITAGAMSVFGVNEWAARAAPLLGATLGALALTLFVRRWVGERAARLALVMLLAQPLFFVGGQFANLDMLIAGVITATTLMLAHAALCAEQGLPYRSTLVLGYAVAALGLLAKGLIGFVIPALVIGVWLLARGRWRALLAMVSLPGALLFSLIALPWFLAMQLRFPDFLDYFFVVQHFKRFAAGGFNNVQPFWFYPALLLAFHAPWLPWARGLFRVRATAAGATASPASVRSLMWVWAAVVLVFFSMPASKLVGYILPLTPPLAMLMADAVLRQRGERQTVPLAWVLATTMAASIGLGAVAWLSLHHDKSSRDFAQPLRAQRQAGEPVVMLRHYAFDLPFYAGLRDKLVVVDDWHDAAVGQRDNWRKELADAGRFAPALADTTLVDEPALPALLCAAPVSWLLGPSDAALRETYLREAAQVHSRDGLTLWRIDQRSSEMFKALGCAGKPNAD